MTRFARRFVTLALFLGLGAMLAGCRGSSALDAFEIDLEVAYWGPAESGDPGVAGQVFAVLPVPVDEIVHADAGSSVVAYFLASRLGLQLQRVESSGAPYPDELHLMGVVAGRSRDGREALLLFTEFPVRVSAETAARLSREDGKTKLVRARFAPSSTVSDDRTRAPGRLELVHLALAGTLPRDPVILDPTHPEDPTWRRLV